MTEAHTAKIDELFAEWNKQHSPGCAVAVVRAGDIDIQRSFGMADLEHSVPITSQSIFDIGSTSKQFTAACILLLAREGKLSLDDDVRKYFPTLPEYKRTITMRHLVHHTSGIRDYLNLTVLSGRPLSNDYSEDEMVALLSRQRGLEFPTGSQYGYSNSGYFLLSEIVRSVSGSSLRTYAEEKIFGPLNMSSTFFHDDFSEVVANRAVGYSPVKDGSGFRINVPLWDVVGDGAVFTNVEDLAKWDRQFYECDLPGGNDFIQELLTPGEFAEGKRVRWNYAFGLTIGQHRGATTVSHGGSWGGYRAEMVRFPDQRLSVIVLANLSTIQVTQLAYRIADLVLEDALEPVKSKESEVVADGTIDLTSWVGFYCDRKRTMLVQIDLDQSTPVLRAFGSSFQLETLSQTRFRLKDLPVTIDLVEPGRIRLNLGKRDRRLLLKVSASPPTDFVEYSGRYHSRELDASYTIDASDGSLRLRRAWMPWETMTPAGGDLFSSGSAVLQFRRSNERVMGFRLGMSRVGHISFSKEGSRRRSH